MMPSTHDLRSTAVDRNRSHSVKAKAKSNPKLVKVEGNDARRPTPILVARRRRIDNEASVRKTNVHRKCDVLGSDRDEDEVIHPYEVAAADENTSIESTSPPDYRFDGNNFDGTAVLEAAVTRAVKKFQDGQTTKLVKEEYDDLDDLSDEEVMGKMDDDFELV